MATLTRVVTLGLLFAFYSHDTNAEFELHFGTNPPTLPMGAFDPNCHDVLDNCEMFGADSCSAQYEQWARDNCAMTCKYCTGPPTKAPPCVDAIDNCASYDPSSCTAPDFSGWANANCRRTCRKCSADVLAHLDSQTTTLSPSQCVDKLDCRLYGHSACSGDYAAWAKINCMNYCGFCIGVPTTPKPCLDTRPNCAQYEKTMCTSPDFHTWAEDNCAKFCNFCGGGSGPVLPNTNGPQPPTPGFPTPQIPAGKK